MAIETRNLINDMLNTGKMEEVLIVIRDYAQEYQSLCYEQDDEHMGHMSYHLEEALDHWR
jgi:hypothetical protein